ncbi:MAG: hypothetical protein FJY16_04705 [Bacteroidetes bacterium]|nr:hypothetical protein [Bacteroidota bacterium]
MKRFISLMVLSVGALFLLVTLISSFFPNHVRVSRAIDIQCQPEVVKSMLAQTTYWKTVLPEGTLFSIQEHTDSSGHIRINNNAAIQMATGYQVFSIVNGPVCSVQRYYDIYFDWYPWEKFSSLLVETKFGLVLEKELAQLKIKTTQ